MQNQCAGMGFFSLLILLISLSCLCTRAERMEKKLDAMMNKAGTTLPAEREKK